MLWNFYFLYIHFRIYVFKYSGTNQASINSLCSDCQISMTIHRIPPWLSGLLQFCPVVATIICRTQLNKHSQNPVHTSDAEGVSSFQQNSVSVFRSPIIASPVGLIKPFFFFFFFIPFISTIHFRGKSKEPPFYSTANGDTINLAFIREFLKCRGTTRILYGCLGPEKAWSCWSKPRCPNIVVTQFEK